MRTNKFFKIMMRTKNIFYCFCFLIGTSLVLLSCKKSPGSIGVGEYHGTYSRDTLVAGLCTTKVTEVNSLTVNLNVHGDSLSAFTLTDVEVDGGDQPYTLKYNGVEGNLTGSMSEDDMQWVLFGAADTITFTGVKEN
jgi:hypothetical protein